MPNNSYKHFIYDHELTLYPYAPLGLLHNQGKWPKSNYKLSIIITASANDLNVIQWLTYHQTLGVDHVYLYCTDDDPTDLYRQIIPFSLGKSPFVTFHHYRFSGPTAKQYLHFIHNYLHETEWYISLDISDYLYINEKQTISDFLNNYASKNAVYFNMFLYKKNETNETVNNKTTLEQYSPINYPCIHTKLMVRSHACPYQYIFHNLDKKIDNHINNESLINQSCNVLGHDMKTYYENFPANAFEILSSNSQEQIITTAYIAHLCDASNEEQISIETSKIYLKIDTEINIPTNETHPHLHHYNPEKYWEKQLKNLWKKSFFPSPPPQLSVLSDGKTCKQSSIPQTSISNNLAEKIINNKLQGMTQTITTKETNPWWEIDLEEIYIIKNIRLFNGIDLNIANMKNFIIESSDDYETWIKRHHKVTSNLFGGVDGSYYNWIHPLGIKARWIRITVPGENKIFSLDQIQIFGMKLKNWSIN